MTKKRDKNQNALKHGAYSRELMLPGEKRSDYEELLQALHDEWVPDGVTEHCLVGELAALYWRKRRVERYEQINLKQRNARIRQDNEGKRHRNHLKKFGASFSECANAEAAEEILAGLDPIYVHTIELWVPRDKCKDPAQWHLEVGTVLSNLKSTDYVEGSDLFASIVTPTSIKVEIVSSQWIDDAIDRTIKRLMQVKTAKQVFPGMRKNTKPLEPKLINPPARSDDSPAVIAKDSPAISEAVVSPKSNQDASVPTNETGIIIEAAIETESVAAEKGHSNSMPVKVDFLPKRTPASVEELNGFSALCKEVFSDPSFSSSPRTL